MHVLIIGSGYVGLTTGCVFAYLGHQVTLLDIDQEKIGSLQDGRVPFHEKGLPEVFSIAKSSMVFTADWEDVPVDVDVMIIAVGTPSLESGEVDLSYVHAAAREIGKRVVGKAVPPVVIKSTVPVGTSAAVRDVIQEELVRRKQFGRVEVLSNPEFLREGEALQDAFYPDRIIVGADDEQTLALIRRLYQPILEQQFTPPAAAPRPDGYTQPAWLVTNSASAEMIKYAGNAFLAMKISFINEFANWAEKAGAQIGDVAKGIGLDRRIGTHFLQAGIGWGGSCFGKDTKAIVQQGKRLGIRMQLVESTLTVNQKQREHVIELLEEAVPRLDGRTIGLLGLSFKPNTDDLRDAPAIDLIRQLNEKGASVKAFDPVAMDAAKKAFPDLSVTYCPRVEDVFTGASAVILVTEWKEFRDLPYTQLGERMAERRIVDARNFLNANHLRQAGFQYTGIGQGQRVVRKRVLVTGGAGFIGSHLVDELLEDGFDVHVVDQFDSFYDRQVKEQNIAQHRLHDKYLLSEVDICDRGMLEEIFKSWQPEMVLHLAARAGVRPSVQRPLSYVEANIVGTTHLLDLSVQYGIKRFVFGSSSSVYGLNEKVPFAETDPLLRCASPYAATKIAGEALCQSYAHCYGLDVIALRFFTVYGPRQRPDLAIHTFVKKMEQGEPIQLYGDGTTSRDYTFVSDIVAGIRKAMEVELTGYHVFNLGNDQPTKLIDLVRTLERVLGKEAIIEWQPVQVGDVPATWADLSKSKRILRYQPQVPIEQGLREYVRWFRSLK
ncbi:nucleotide sugar dehydrogenase [Brevibacillus migulae]|uniref:nucleotide sugar dehydrogenase n=1 Tax=Brevibacillus migulae TaxID=1644114 RepID=UPI00196AD180|nr:nucleotide sugar dehydrogenase [Brevibacillus migulae]